MATKIVKFMRNYGLALGVLVLAWLFIVDLIFLPPAKAPTPAPTPAPTTAPSNVPKLSEIKGPSIGGEAASTTCPSNATTCGLPTAVKTCTSLPANMWIFILATYLFLLIFNLGATFEKRQTVQWGFEAILTLAALGVWFRWDQCFANLWFPLYVLTLGILIYLFYLYFFFEKQKAENSQPEYGQEDINKEI